MNGPVIAGVDGSSASPRCVAWAAAEAGLRRRPLDLVHASMLLYRDGSLSEAAYERLEAERSRVLEDAREYALMVRPGLEVRVGLLAEEAGRALVAQSQHAEMIVVGTRGTGGFEGLLLGSVGLYVAANSRCPVLAIPASAPEPGAAPAEVVLGVEERHHEDQAIGWAFEESSLRNAHLTAIHAFGEGFGAPRQKISEDMLLEALAGRTAKYPDVPVTRTITEQHPARALVAASDQAAIVVVGARRRQGLTGMTLGTVNHALLHHALSAVAVVPET